MSLRVTGGELRGRLVKLPNLEEVRPTSEKVRQAIFSAVENQIEIAGLCVLDLFAGSGALGIEGLSRGAAHCVFVDSSPRVCHALETSLAELGLETRATVRRALVDEFIASGESPLSQFGLIFADPPYALVLDLHFIRGLFQSDLLAPEGVLVIETAKRNPDFPTSFVGCGSRIDLVRNRTYGDTKVMMFRWKPDPVTNA